MILITPAERISATEELIHSVHESIRDLRRAAEDLRERILSGEEGDLAGNGKRMGQAQGLIRDCQKLEAQLVEYLNREAGIAQGGYALDLEIARDEIGGRLARLRAAGRTGAVSD